MAKSLADQFGPDTIRKFERASPQRFEEAESLASKGHYLTAIYLYGYTAEMLIKAAYFRMLRYGVTTEIDRDVRNRVMGRARQTGLMSKEPHDIAGWGRVLVDERGTLYPPDYESKFGEQITNRSSMIYDLWRPQMRYRATEASETQANAARKIADWFRANYEKM